MPAITSTAPGKIILFGEHAVVYGQPAIAVPVVQVQSRAVVNADPKAPSSQVRILAPDIGLDSTLDQLPENHPLGVAVKSVFTELKIKRIPAFSLQISSSIPLAAGLGSGASVSTAVIRAVSIFLGCPLADERVSSLVFEVEKLLHGTPSGIDNTVITYAMPVYFQLREERNFIETIRVAAPFTIVIGDTGVRSPTSLAVGDLRQSYITNPNRYELIFDQVGAIVTQARQMIVDGNPAGLGRLMNENQILLGELGVSSPELDQLVKAGREAGALGAKLSGGGRGGNMIALVEESESIEVAKALVEAGAIRTLITEIHAN